MNTNMPMHRVIAGQLKAFAEQFEVKEKESKTFEAFVNYVIFRCDNCG